jgi:hypothetical protein
MPEQCPYHEGVSEAADRAAIWRELHDVFAVTSDAVAQEAQRRSGEFDGFRQDLVLTEGSVFLSEPENPSPLLGGANGRFSSFLAF